MSPGSRPRAVSSSPHTASHAGCGGQGKWSFVAALVPRSAIASFVPSLPSDASVFADRRLLDTSMQQFVGCLLDTDDNASAIEQYAIEQLVMEMCGAVLLDRVGGVSAQGSPHAVLRERAIAVISQQCGDPSLKPVARRARGAVVVRQLQLVFSESGNSVAAEIRRQRARLAHSLLVDSRYDVLSIDQIAQRAGFPLSDEHAQGTRRGLSGHPAHTALLAPGIALTQPERHRSRRLSAPCA